MVTKQLLNKPDTMVVEGLSALVACNPHLALLDGLPHTKVVVDTQADKSKVAIISGGGSGHEPAFAGYVGAGMLTAAVAGDIFASPTEDAVLAAIRATCGPAGCLVVVMNYTGDRLNFGAAVERAKAEGLAVELVVVADDCALSGRTPVGRRGIAGTVLVLKVAGAVAAAGGTLADVKAAAERAAANVGTMGCSLTACTLPGKAASTRLGPDEMEMGLGIHGEPGAYAAKIKPVSAIVAEIVDKIAAETDCYLPISPGEHVGLLVNNLGSTPQLEMQVAAQASIQAVQSELKATVVRCWVGTHMTSLDMHGFSITLMRLGNKGSVDEETLKLLDAPTQAACWPYKGDQQFTCDKPLLPLPTGPTDDAIAAATSGGSGEAPSGAAETLRRCLQAACDAVAAAEGELNELDGKIGDADCGSTLARGGRSVADALSQGALPLEDPSAASLVVGRLVGQSMGGTSGAIYKILLTAAAGSLRQAEAAAADGGITTASAAAALQAGAAAVSKYGGAVQGSRTMLDALLPAAEALQQAASAKETGAAAAQRAAEAAASGAEATKEMVAMAGRSSYVPQEVLRGVPDPGAVAVARWLAAVAQALQG